MQQASHAEFDLLATRHLSGESTGPDKRRMRDLLKNKEWSARFDRMQRIWEAAGMKPVVSFDVQAAAARLAASIGNQPDPDENIAPPQRRITGKRRRPHRRVKKAGSKRRRPNRSPGS